MVCHDVKLCYLCRKMNLGDLVDSWELPDSNCEELKSWLENEGWDLTSPPDQAFWDLTTNDLRSAGVTQRRSQIRLERQLQQGRKEGKSICVSIQLKLQALQTFILCNRQRSC